MIASHEFPTPEFLIEPMIPLGGIAILYGKPGVGKTQLIMTLAHAINTGTPFLGRWPVHQGPVVVIQADMTGQIQQARVIRAMREVDISSTYWAVEPDGSIPMIDITTLSLLNSDLVEQIHEVDPVLIVWDTLRKVHMLPENASESVIRVYNGARRVSPLATHLFNHHTRKMSRDPDAIDTLDEDFIGSQQWKGAADTTFTLQEIDTAPKRLSLEFHKARTAPDEEKEPVILEVDTRTILLLPLRSRRSDTLVCRAEAWRTGTSG